MAMILRDSQRKKVYDWESVGSVPTLTLDECEALVAKAYARFGLTWQGRIADGRGRRKAGGRYQYVTLPRWGRRPDVVLHEAAHGIADQLARRASLDIAAHGPEFAYVVLQLRVWQKLTPTLAKGRADAARCGVKVSRDQRFSATRARAERREIKALRGW